MSSNSLAMILFPLACGLGCAFLAIALRGRAAWFAATIIRVSGSELGTREARWLPRLCWTGAAAWLAIFLLVVFPFPHAQRPYLVLLLTAPLGRMTLRAPPR